MKISYLNLDRHFSVKTLFLAVFSVLFFAGQSKGQVVVEMKLDTAEILVGQQVQLSTTVSADRKQNVKFPSFKAGEEIVKGLEVISQSSVDTSFIDDNKRLLLNRKYTVTSFDSALFNIPAMKVVVDADTFEAKSTVGLKVSMVPVDTTKLEQFAGPHTVVPETFNWRNRLLGLSLCLWIFLLLVFVISIKLTRRKPLTTKKVIKPQIPPFKQASTALKEINVKVSGNSDGVKDFFIKLTDTLRVYIQRRFEVLALEKTTEEILNAMNGKAGESEISDLKLIFETADLVKFAKFIPSEFDMDRCLTAAEKFLNNTVDDSMEHPEPEVHIIILNDGMQHKYRTMLWASLGILCVGGLAYAYYVSCSVFHSFL